MFRQLLSSLWSFIAVLALILSFSIRVDAVYGEKNSFTVLGCFTWWSHDAVGYHPSMYLFLENTTGHPVGGAEIPFQGRFTDLRSGEVTVAREYKRAPVRNHDRFAILLRGPRSYELPIDSSLWPSIECKAMCRLTDAEDLYIGHLASVTMTDEDAQAQLVAQAGRNPLLSKGNRDADLSLPRLQMQDSDQTANEINVADTSLGKKYNAKSKHKVVAKPIAPEENTKKSSDNTLPKHFPALGDDFYVFDKLYGNATEFQASGGIDNLTWTHYKSSSLVKDIYAGSRKNNKADVIIITISGVLKDKNLLLLAKQLAHCKKSEPIASFTHSVAYLSSGRSEIMTTAIRECKILSSKIHNANNTSTVLVVSRLSGDLEVALTNYSQRVPFLKFLNL